MTVALRFINNSNDQNNSQIVIFQGSGPDAAVDAAPGSPLKIFKAGTKGYTIRFDVPAVARTLSISVQEKPAGRTVAPSVHPLSIAGVTSADIVMTGGGTGAAATPFQFTLQNVVKA